jgi:DNA repair protein RadC
MKSNPSLNGYSGKITSWPEEERPRERLLRKGPEHLSDAHLLAVLLRTGGKGHSALDMAMALLNRFGGIRGVAAANMAELCALTGIGPAKVAQIKASVELGRRLISRPLEKRQKVTSSRDVYAVYQHYFPFLHDIKKEIFKILLLDGRHQIFGETTISEGTLTASLVHPREVYAPAIRNSAAAVLLIHNHPSGDPTPSAEDVEITRRLIQGGEILGIRVLDHIVLGDGKYVSFVDSGLM